MSGESPRIEVTCDGPFVVFNIPVLVNSKGTKLKTESTYALCRCGKSKSKPFCDGAHASIGFSGDKSKDRVPVKTIDYRGNEITVHYNAGVCSWSGNCSRNLPSVFPPGGKPPVLPDMASPKEIATITRICPSGALSHTMDGKLFNERSRPVRITIERNGPYKVVGKPTFIDPEKDNPQSGEHFTLCRCGESKNKPFCDGTHVTCKFSDEKN